MTEQGAPARHPHPFAAVAHAGGLVLDVPEYQESFDRDHALCSEPMWKLERAQHFFEPDVASWRAMMDGDWERSMALTERMAAPLTEHFRHRFPVRRVRVVEFPISAYLQWELHVLATRARVGSPCRVVRAERVAALDPLPELVIFSPSLMYEVLYDTYGGCVGGRRITDRAVVEPCLRTVRYLFEAGEDVLGFHEREIVPLPPPLVTDEMRAALPAYAHRTEEFRV
ncbi:hypothetical protein FH608_026240 [Nonomuraea phyllanthi]|uniref:DUF6879 domain-containing protein n=1 Tax=Nonomuraea phyllanthi TaxID=2219224 RepID=A0A5C4W6J1_9ACTN|nr:DUF6879 family protein [Nonomuraea phyllanthi]KAB8192199.1 hypothetical protein FH608_026240 [Nonomuraea phyllanthi]QFY11449.1 hypothetical protein GBF35_37055 [Nonomuraea phyllanthi]